MPEAARRDGRQTRAHISNVATGMILERGFEQVTVAEVAAAAGVSKVTVFTHFPRKEDLLLDEAPEASALIREALADRPGGEGPVEALRRLAFRLRDEQHALTGFAPASLPFVRTVAASPSLVTRAREIAADLESELAELLAAEVEPVGDPEVLAALVMGAYRTVFVSSARRLVAGDDAKEIAQDHDGRLERAFDALEAAAGSLAAASAATPA